MPKQRTLTLFQYSTSFAFVYK